jgi:hypothetical protein
VPLNLLSPGHHTALTQQRTMDDFKNEQEGRGQHLDDASLDGVASLEIEKVEKRLG